MCGIYDEWCSCGEDYCDCDTYYWEQKYRDEKMKVDELEAHLENERRNHATFVSEVVSDLLDNYRQAVTKWINKYHDLLDTYELVVALNKQQSAFLRFLMGDF